MKKLLLALVLLIMFTLTGCDAFGDGEPMDYTKDFEELQEEIKEGNEDILDRMAEIDAEVIEVPVIVKDTQIVELPGEVVIEYVEVIKIERMEVRTLFYPEDGDSAIFVVGMGTVSYVLEFAYHTPLVGNTYAELFQIERQINGIKDDWFLPSAHSDQNVVDAFTYELLGWDDFVREVEYFLDVLTWEEIEDIYNALYNDYYGIE